MTDDFWIALHRDALAGDAKARQTLMRELLPIVQHRVGKILLAQRESIGRRRLRQEVEELTQQVLVGLINKDWWVFRKWSPSRGRSLPNFIRKFAEWKTYSILRTRSLRPWIEGELGADDAALADKADETACPEGITASRELAELIYDGARKRLSELGWTMFEMIVLEDLSAEEISTLTGMAKGTVFVWKNRLRALIRELIEQHERDIPKDQGEHEESHHEQGPDRPDSPAPRA